jgi:hypothetical protein
VVVAMLIVPARVATRMTYFPAIVLTGVPVRGVAVVAVVGITVTVTAMPFALGVASAVTLRLNIAMSLAVVALALIPMATGLAGMGRWFGEGRYGHDECQSGDCELEHGAQPGFVPKTLESPSGARHRIRHISRTAEPTLSPQDSERETA